MRVFLLFLLVGAALASSSSPIKRVVFCFDGTGQDPADAIQKSKKADNNISNVLKLHLLFGGDLSKGNAHGMDQQSLYYSGVGTRGSPLLRLVRQAFATKAPQCIQEEAMEDLQHMNLEPDAEICVIGFSRGAAIARQFCSKLAEQNRKVELLLCYDTVASIGMPDVSISRRPRSDVLFEDRALSPSVKQAIHCVSLDDKRTIFQPTLMNRDDRVTELWFAGNHGDIGGGWKNDGLSDVVLDYSIQQIKKRTDLKVLTTDEIRYEDNFPIEKEDVDINPNVLGTTHEQTFSTPIENDPLKYHRHLVVVENDEIAPQYVPLLHESVVERIRAMPDYRPGSLFKDDEGEGQKTRQTRQARQTRHKVVDSSGHTSNIMESLNDHLS